MHHIQDIAAAILPPAVGVYTALEASNIILKVLFGGLSVIYITMKIIYLYKNRDKKPE